ncbi:shikimate kinase, partial [Neisseria sp. P0009.S005]
MTLKEKINGNLILIGLVGAGKTTLGKQLAHMYECPFYDSDYEIFTSS